VEPQTEDELANPAAAASGAGDAAGGLPANHRVALVNPPPEIGGREGPDPTRYGDWELRGRCIDF
jgi:hypothetical protein